jgi:hypothetical protein
VTTGKDDRSRDAGPTGRRSFYDWWLTLPGVLTAITGGLVAAGGLLTAVRSLDGDGAMTAPMTAPPPPPPPISVSGSPPSRSETVTVDKPSGSEAPRCSMFRGSAMLGTHRTLVLGARRVDPADPEKLWYFESHVIWTGTAGQGGWRSPRHLGSDATQHYLVDVVSIDRTTLRNVLAADKSDDLPSTWVATKQPPGAAVVKRLRVTQVQGKGDCPTA